MSDFGAPGKGFSSFVNFDVSREMPVEPFKGVIMSPNTINPGTELGQTTKTVWLNSADGHLYRGAVDLEDLTDISALEAAVAVIEGQISDILNRLESAEITLAILGIRMRDAEADITTIEGDITTIEGDIATINNTIATLPIQVSTSGNMTSSSPIQFGSIPYSVTRVGDLVVLTIQPKSFSLTAPVANIAAAGGIPAGYRPSTTMTFPMVYKTNGVYDTGMVGAITISASGLISFIRDKDAAPSNFDGLTGWDEAIQLSYSRV